MCRMAQHKAANLPVLVTTFVPRLRVLITVRWGGFAEGIVNLRTVTNFVLET
jgi:hypothetical protein